MAEAFLHVATQAPHPIQAAASKALSASCLSIGIELASCVFPEVLTLTNPPACCTRSKEERSTVKSLITGKKSPLHHTEWLDELDDSMKAYIK